MRYCRFEREPAGYLGASNDVFAVLRGGSASGNNDEAGRCLFEGAFDELPFFEFEAFELSDGCAEPIAGPGVEGGLEFSGGSFGGGDVDEDGFGDSSDVDGAGVGAGVGFGVGVGVGFGVGLGVGLGSGVGLGDSSGEGPGVGDGAGVGAGFTTGPGTDTGGPSWTGEPFRESIAS